MKAEYINPFLESVDELFGSMLACKAQRGQLATSKGQPTAHELTAVIGLSGPTRGTVAISFPVETATAMVSRLMGGIAVDDGETLIDGVSELVNIVAGGAKARLSAGAGAVIDLSLPTVIRGKNFQINSPSQAVWLDIPFDSELGGFCVRVTFAS